jgi:hypothetical protein
MLLLIARDLFLIALVIVAAAHVWFAGTRE